MGRGGLHLRCIAGLLALLATLAMASAQAETQVEEPMKAFAEQLAFRRNVHAVCANPNLAPEMVAFRNRYRRADEHVDSDCPR